NTLATSYLQDLQDAVSRTVLSSVESATMDQPGGVFVRRIDDFREEDLLMLRATARMIVTCDGRALARVLRPARAAEEARGDGAAAGNGVAARDGVPAEDAAASSRLTPLRIPGRATPTRTPVARDTPPGLLASPPLRTKTAAGTSGAGRLLAALVGEDQARPASTSRADNVLNAAGPPDESVPAQGASRAPHDAPREQVTLE